MEINGGMISTGENSSLVHQSFLAILPAETSGIKQKWAKKKIEFGLAKYFCSYLQLIFYVP
jgi:hypothetical protein